VNTVYINGNEHSQEANTSAAKKTIISLVGKLESQGCFVDTGHINTSIQMKHPHREGMVFLNFS